MDLAGDNLDKELVEAFKQQFMPLQESVMTVNLDSSV